MKSNKDFKKIKTVWVVTLNIVMTIFCGCKVTSKNSAYSGSNQSAAIMSVLEDMVEKADSSGILVRFVDLNSSGINCLRERCGKKYLIYPIKLAKEDNDGIYLENEHKQGEILKVYVQEINLKECIIVGTCNISGASFSAFSYKLICVRGSWEIVSTKFLMAS